MRRVCKRASRAATAQADRQHRPPARETRPRERSTRRQIQATRRRTPWWWARKSDAPCWPSRGHWSRDASQTSRNTLPPWSCSDLDSVSERQASALETVAACGAATYGWDSPEPRSFDRVQPRRAARVLLNKSITYFNVTGVALARAAEWHA